MDIRKRWTDFMPHHGRLLGFVAVAVVAFSLGMLFTGGDDMSEPDRCREPRSRSGSIE